MSDTTNRLYEKMIHCAALNEHIGSADLAILLYVSEYNLLIMGLAETWIMTRISIYEETKVFPTY